MSADEPQDRIGRALERGWAGTPDELLRHAINVCMAETDKLRADLASTKAGLGEMVNGVLPRHRDLMHALREEIVRVRAENECLRRKADDLANALKVLP